MVQHVKNPPAMQEVQPAQVQSLGWEVPLEKEMAAHSNILPRNIPWTEEPGRLESIGSQRVWHSWACAHTHLSHLENKGYSEYEPRHVTNLPNTWTPQVHPSRPNGISQKTGLWMNRFMASPKKSESYWVYLITPATIPMQWEPTDKCDLKSAFQKCVCMAKTDI